MLPNGFDLTHLVQGTEAETGKGRSGYGAGANYLATKQIYSAVKGSDAAAVQAQRASSQGEVPVVQGKSISVAADSSPAPAAMVRRLSMAR